LLRERVALSQQQQQSAASVVFTRVLLPTVIDAGKILNLGEFFPRG
jgi:hypothetical protein